MTDIDSAITVLNMQKHAEMKQGEVKDDTGRSQEEVNQGYMMTRYNIHHQNQRKKAMKIWRNSCFKGSAAYKTAKRIQKNKYERITLMESFLDFTYHRRDINTVENLTRFMIKKPVET